MKEFVFLTIVAIEIAHCAHNSKLWKKIYIYIIECHMEVNETILKMP